MNLLDTFPVPDQEWVVEFTTDVSVGRRRFRAFSVVDRFSGECLALKIDTSFTSECITRTLSKLVDERGVPAIIRRGNGPAVRSRHFLAWCIDRSIATASLLPGESATYTKVNTFHRRFRE